MLAVIFKELHCKFDSSKTSRVNLYSIKKYIFFRCELFCVVLRCVVLCCGLCCGLCCVLCVVLLWREKDERDTEPNEPSATVPSRTISSAEMYGKSDNAKSGIISRIGTETSSPDKLQLTDKLSFKKSIPFAKFYFILLYVILFLLYGYCFLVKQHLQAHLKSTFWDFPLLFQDNERKEHKLSSSKKKKKLSNPNI
jgi:hypothetical protein